MIKHNLDNHLQGVKEKLQIGIPPYVSFFILAQLKSLYCVFVCHLKAIVLVHCTNLLMNFFN